ncbi:diaminopimelate decarboxylase [Candidatus Soleaferrea massiliensis]|uniref:diaminopimelate decarboxylase n=1 Tax=Candidatus Soleaferrea massiliensis TaxID=1470354 RepID=UPI00058E9934|nr:diaminopimelate decarboxylase [Candidatus Soleaferrea massiliensis]
MFVSDCLNINEKGHLTIGGKDTVELAKQYGTPLYVMDEQQIRENCRAYVRSIDRCYDGKGMVAFASKAFCCRAMCRIANEEKLGLDVVSEGELYTAVSSGFPASRLVFHGNNKTVSELRYALECGVGRIVVDNPDELVRLQKLAEEMDVTAEILFRIKPGIDAHTHSFIRTGQIDSKFGLALETGEALQVVKQAIGMRSIHVRGVHCHIGSQIFDIQPFELASEVMLRFIAQVKAETGAELSELNLGGGFGIKYTEQDKPVPYDQYMEKVSQTVKKTCEELGINCPFIIIEPGRSIVGTAGITLYTVGALKDIPNIRTYISVDGGMTDNPRYALYQSEYEVLVADRADQPRVGKVTVAGKCCESGDLIGENLPVQDVRAGDTLAVLSTGAYNYSMSSNYNRIPKPAVVMVNGGSERIVVKRETLADIVRNDLD